MKTAPTAAAVARPFTRAGVPSPRPNRSFGGLYRTAEHEAQGETVGGVPLQTAEDAVVAAVRMGYRIADEQIERGRRIASGLRGAAARAGVESAGDAVDGVEQLITRTLQSGLQFVEEAARDPQNPIKRLASAELSFLASLFGLRSPVAAPQPPSSADGAPRNGAPPAERRADKPASVPDWRAADVRIQHDAASDARAVRVMEWQGDIAAPYTNDVIFHHLAQDAAPPMKATFEHLDRGPLLRVTTAGAHPAGRWRAAVLDPDRIQIGVLEIEI